MAKSSNDSVMDGLLDIIDQADLMSVCSSQPTTFTEATVTYKLASVAVTPDTDFTKADGTISGRKVTVAAKAALIDTGGNGTHVALTKSAGSVLVCVTTCDLKALEAGGTVNIPSWSAEVSDPT